MKLLIVDKKPTGVMVVKKVEEKEEKNKKNVDWGCK